MFDRLRHSMARRERFNAKDFELILSKSRAETKYGRLFNLALSLFLDLARQLKGLRVAYHGRRSDLFGRNRKKVQIKQSAGFPPPGNSGQAFVQPFLLFVVEDSLAQCEAYRVTEKIRHFERIGVRVLRVSCWTPAVAYHHMAFAKAVLFYRVAALPEALPLLREAKRLGLPCAWEVDDLIFDAEEYKKHPYFLRCAKTEGKELLEGARLFAEAMTFVTHGVASTHPLAMAMARRISGEIHVIENALSEEIIAASESVVNEKRFRAPITDGSVRIGYGSGTFTHDDDYAKVVQALVRVLEKHAKAHLVVMGHLQLPAELAPFARRMVRVPFAKAEVYYRAVAELDINLAPLTPSTFNEAKSNIKWLEAAIFEVPTIASPSEPFRRAISSGVDGFLATTEEEWFEALDALVSQAGFRRQVGVEARKTALRLYAPELIAQNQVRPFAESLGLTSKQTRDRDKTKSSSSTSLTGRVVNKARLASVNVFFAPLSFGGATVVAEEMAKSLAKRHGWDVTIFAGNIDDSLPDHFATRYEIYGLPALSVRLPRSAPEPISYRNDAVRRIFADYLDAVKPQVVHFHSIQLLGAGMLEECEERGIPFAVTLHDAWWMCARQFRYFQETGRRCDHRPVTPLRCLECMSDRVHFLARTAYLQATLAKASVLLAPSQFQRQLYIDNGSDPKKVVVNENGVRAPRRPRARTSRPGPNHVVFAYLGGPSKLKGYHFVTEAFSQIEEADYTLRLTNSDLKLGVNTVLGKDFTCRGNLEVVVPFDQESIDTFFDGIDVLLVPSQWDECFGLVLREALIRDVWAIVSDSGALPEAVQHGVNGSIFPRDDLSAFKASVVDCIRNAESFKTYRNPLREKVLTFEDQARDLDSILASLVGSPAPIESFT